MDKPKNSKDFYGLRYGEFVVPLVMAVQELSKKAERVEELERKNRQLEDRLTRLEAVINGSSNGNLSNRTSASIDQNVPNPTNGSTTIHYYVPYEATSAKVVFTNTEGRQIKSITISIGGAGQITLNSGTLSSGTYNYSLWIDGKQVNTKRLIVSR